MQETISVTLEWKRLSNVTSLSLSFVIFFERNQEFYCFQLKKRKERLLGAGGGRMSLNTSPLFFSSLSRRRQIQLSKFSSETFGQRFPSLLGSNAQEPLAGKAIPGALLLPSISSIPPILSLLSPGQLWGNAAAPWQSQAQQRLCPPNPPSDK